MRNRVHLLEQIQAIHENKQTGVLSLTNSKNVISVHFEKGLINAVTTDLPQFRLGKYLKDAGVIDDAEIKQLVRDARRHRMPFGQAAVRKTLIDGKELVDLIQEQAVETLTYALVQDYGISSFDRKTRDFRLKGGIDLNHLMLQMARKNLKPFHVEPNQFILMKNGTSLNDLPWFPEELAVLSKLSVPRRMQELEEATGLDDLRLSKILSVFESLKLIESVDPSAETMAIAKREGFTFESLIPEIQKNGLNDKLESFLDESSFVSEQFKNLKVRIAGLAALRPTKIMTVSSPDVGAGKSIVSANLAASFSKDTRRKTILVDCDLRNPNIHRLLGASIEPGLIGYLQEGLLQPTFYMRRMERLFVMTAGGFAKNPVELLSSDNMQFLIEFLRTEFDTVILDSAPLGPISDARILAGLSDGLILVIRSGKTSYGSIERSINSGLDRSKLMGLVLNDVKPRMFHTQYDYRYYRYKYGSRYPYHKGIPRHGIHLKSYLEQ